MLDAGDLIACYLTLAHADRHGTARVSFADRVHAAASAGFAGVGISPGDYLRSRAEGRTDADLRAVVDDAGVVVAELDAARGWLDDDYAAAAAREHEDTLMAIGDAFGVRHLVASHGQAPGELPPPDVAAARFARLCDRAGQHGMLVALEFYPWAAINDVAAAWEIVRAADRANGGILLDCWHHRCGTNDDVALQAIPADRIVAVQLTDGAPDSAEPDPLRRTMTQRRFLGHGTLDIDGLLGALFAMGVSIPMSVEVVSLEHWHLPVDETARLAYETTRSALERVRAGRT